MDRIKISEAIAAINGLCLFFIVIGVFLPFAKVEIWGYEVVNVSIFKFLTDSDIKELLTYTETDTDVITAVVIFIVAFVASLASGANFKSNINLTPAIIMVIAAAIGKYMTGQLTDAVFQFGIIKKLIGSDLLTWGYKILLWDSIAAFIVNFYLNYIAGSDSSFAKSFNNIIGVHKIQCENCGKINIGTGKWCSGCGHELPEVSMSSNSSKTWFCEKCNAENPENAKFCGKCGNPRS